MFPDRRARGGTLTRWFEAVCASLTRCRSGRIRVEGQAALVWTADSCSGCLAELDEALVALVRAEGPNSGLDLLGHARDAVQPTDPSAWWLHWLGVAPEARGGGAGGRALDMVVTAARSAARPLATTTVNPLVLPLYARAGLLSLGAPVRVDRHGGLLCWTLQTAAPASAREV